MNNIDFKYNLKNNILITIYYIYLYIAIKKYKKTAKNNVKIRIFNLFFIKFLL